MMLEPTWQSGDVQLYLGDCLEILPQLADKSVDAVITDPPYGVGIDYTNLFDDTRENCYRLLNKFIPESIRISSGAVLFPSGSLPTEIWLYQNHPPKWRICWYKGAQSTLSAIGFCDWEMIMVYGDKVHNYVHDYMPVKTTPANNGHPCPKDVRWGTWLINKFSKTGKTILDPFMGSGTTGVACVQTGRKFIGIEIEPKYFDIAVKRIQQAQLQIRMEI